DARHARGRAPGAEDPARDDRAGQGQDVNTRVATYIPRPNTAWFSTLLRVFRTGVSVFEEANPAPTAGCMMKSAAATVPPPPRSACSREGFDPHASTRIPAKAMPIA